MGANPPAILRFSAYAHAEGCCHLARVRYKPGERIDSHQHDFAEVFWVETGEALHSINGRHEPLCAGFVRVVAPSDAHSLRAKWNTEMVVCNVAFPARELFRLLDEYRGNGYRATEMLANGSCVVREQWLESIRAAFTELETGTATTLELHQELVKKGCHSQYGVVACDHHHW